MRKESELKELIKEAVVRVVSYKWQLINAVAPSGLRRRLLGVADEKQFFMLMKNRSAERAPATPLRRSLYLPFPLAQETVFL